MKKAIMCMVSDTDQATRIVDSLKEAGFTRDDISVLMPDKGGTQDFAYEKNTKAPEGATAGVTAGGVLGGALGLLVGLGALVIPGLGPFLAAGPLMAALSGAAVGGAVGGIAGALIGLGLPEVEAKRYEGKIKEGNILISVHAENAGARKRVRKIFEAAGASDIANIGESKADAAA